MSDKQVISIVFESDNNSGNINDMASNTKIHRIGFFFTFNDAQTGTDDIALGSLGFLNTDWSTTTSPVRTSSVKGFCKTGAPITNSLVVSSDDVGYSRCATGPYIRILMTTTYNTPEDIRIWLRLKIYGNTYKYYTLAFSYAGQSTDSVTNKIFNNTSSSIVYSGIYRLIELEGPPSRTLGKLTRKIADNWGSLQTYLGQADSTITDIADQSTSNTGTLKSAVLDKFYNSTTGILASLKVYGGNSYTNPTTATPDINVGKNIPAWTPTSGTIDGSNLYLPCFDLGKVSGTPTSNSTQPYYAQLGYQSIATSGQEYNYLSRVLMDYGSTNKKCVNKLVIFSPTPGYNVEWSKFEIVASTNGIDFIRLPTKWYAIGGSETIIETTFSLYWKRARSGNAGNTAYSIVPGLSGSRAQDVVSKQTSFPLNSYFPWSSTATATTGAPLFMWNIDIDNNSEYRYYGFGNVGSDIYFSGNTATLNTTITRSPCGYSGMSAVGAIYSWASYGTSSTTGWSTNSNPLLNTTNIPNIGNVDKIRIFLPQVSSQSSVPEPTYYKYWRIRPTTSFLATIGTGFNLYLWKLGLYRTTAEATADTYGFSSNNYLQQYGNTMYINDSPVSATPMFVHTGVWSESNASNLNASGYNNLKLPISNNSSNIYFKLDVYGEIKAIRLPDYMYFDANVRGGTFILERGNALSITGISNNSGTTTATATTASAHPYTPGDRVSIAGATISGYNLSVVITGVPTTTSFNYTIASGLGTPSGTITSILWEPMVVTKTNSSDILARNGIMSESAAGNLQAVVALTTASSVYTIETVDEATTRIYGGSRTYNVPTGANAPTVTSGDVIAGQLTYNTTNRLEIELTGGTNISYNTEKDFSIHFSSSSTPLDLSSVLTKFNCTIISYSSPKITFDTIPDFTGDGYFHIFIRNGIGTGTTTNTASIVTTANPVKVTPYSYILDERVITSSPAWTDMSDISGYTRWPITVNNTNKLSNYIEYKPDILGEYALALTYITDLRSTSTTATATTATAHSYTTGNFVSIMGASPTGYNFSSVAIIVTGPTTFTYTVASGLAVASGTITSNLSQPITNKMFRSTGASAFSGTTGTTVTGIKYLMIIENESCLFNTAAISNSVKWKATAIKDNTKTLEVNTNKGTFSTSIADSETGKYKTNFTFTNTTASDWFSNVYVNGCPVTADNNISTSIGPLTAAKGIRFTNIGAGSVDAALGGLCGTDYVMHIEFKIPVTIQITGFNAFATDTGTYLGRGTSGTNTFANYPRFGAFNAYAYGFEINAGTPITNISTFISETTSICTGLGIPMLETSASLAPVLSKAYGMPIDVNASFNYYNGLTSTDGTAITFSQAYPTTFLRSFRSIIYSNTGLLPIDLYSSSKWPWAGYASNNGLGSDKPNGYFVDPTSGLSAIGNNGTLPAAIIKVSPTSKKYVYVNAASNGWVIGGIKGATNPVTPFGASPSFRGTILDTTPATLMTLSIPSINYTAISWVGCAFHNQTCLAPISGAKQSFVWSGFYLGSGIAQSSPTLMNSSNINDSKVIVWDIALANGETPSYSSGTYITNAAAPHNVLTWTPLSGTDPSNRNAMHVFTLLINNNVTITSASDIDIWVQLYQNGIKLLRANITNSTNLRTIYSAGALLKFMHNTLFTQITSSSVLSTLFSGASTAGGTPAANAYAITGTGTQWSFAENDVRTRSSSLYNSADVFTIMADLGTKWGIVPPLCDNSVSSDIFQIIIGKTPWTGNFKLGRVGFFSSIVNALDGSNPLDLARDNTTQVNRLGFISSIGWDWNFSPPTADIDNGTRGTWSKTSNNDASPPNLQIGKHWTNVMYTIGDISGIPCGPFIRLHMLFTTSGTMSTEAPKLRIRLILRHNGVETLYGLGFSYNGIAYNTADEAFLGTDGSILAYKGVFRLVKANSISWSDHDLLSGSKWAWSNPYTIEMDSKSPSITLGEAKNFASGANSVPISSFTSTFKNQYLPSTNTCNMKRFYYASAGVSIPSWNGMWTSTLPAATAVQIPYDNIYSSIDTGFTANSVNYPGFIADSVNCPLGNDTGTNVSDSLVRYMWFFTSAVCLNKLMFYSGTPGWQSEWIKFEIVASTDGINFVRLPTEWSVSGLNTVEDTFHIKYNRKSKGNYDTFVFADTLTAIPFNSSTNITSGKFLLSKTNTRPIAWYVSFINDKKYQYYGFGNVGTDTPYYDRSVANVTTRTYSRRPFSSSLAGTLHQTTALSGAGYTAVMTTADLMANSGNLPWLSGSLSNPQGYATAIIPILSTGSSTIPNAKYKYWRLRATSGFIGATGTAKVYFWKLGLYRNFTDADADTTGLSSSNYFQQYANIVNNNGTVVLPNQNATTLKKHKAICVNLGSWAQTYTDASSFGGIGGKDALGTNANLVSFSSESSYFLVTLDVSPDIESATIASIDSNGNITTGQIPVIRFPNFMRFDNISMGGGL